MSTHSTPEYQREWRNRNIVARRAYERRYRQINIKHCREYDRFYAATERLTVLLYYSDGTLCCACCGEGRYEFLTLDHTGGGGCKHRRAIGVTLPGWLIRNNYPSGYRVLCSNCNCARGSYGYCPHDKEERK